MNQQRFEYKFLRIESGFFRSAKKMDAEYQKAVHEYARNGWRLVQIFAPSIGVYGASTFYELVLERPIDELSTQ
jgi:hypothetical protein